MQEVYILWKIVLVTFYFEGFTRVVTLMIAAPSASDAPPPKPPKIQAASRGPKLGEAAAQMVPMKTMAHESKNTGRLPKYIAVGTQKKF